MSDRRCHKSAPNKEKERATKQHQNKVQNADQFGVQVKENDAIRSTTMISRVVFEGWWLFIERIWDRRLNGASGSKIWYIDWLALVGAGMTWSTDTEFPSSDGISTIGIASYSRSMRGSRHIEIDIESQRRQSVLRTPNLTFPFFWGRVQMVWKRKKDYNDRRNWFHILVRFHQPG